MTIEDDTDPFNAAFDRREERRILSEIDMTFRRAGLSVEQAEHSRVASLIEREQRYRAREQDRQLAEIEYKDGNFVNIGDTVVEPTEEWLSKGQVRMFTPRQPKGTVRTVKTARRVLTPVVVKEYNNGTITEEQLAACLWYRSRFERASLDGNYVTMQFSNTPGIGTAGSKGMVSGHMPLNLAEAQAREEFRLARKSMVTAYLKFFDKIVLEDLPLRRAARFGRLPYRKAGRFLSGLANQLIVFCQASDIDLLTDKSEGDA